MDPKDERKILFTQVEFHRAASSAHYFKVLTTF